MRLAFLLVISCFASAGASNIFGQSKNAAVAPEKEVFLCTICQTMAKIVRRYSKSIAKFADIPCYELKYDKTCTGTVKMFLGALELTGERNACSLIKFCKGAALPLEIPQVLGNVSHGLNAVKDGIFKITSDPLGGLAGALGGLAQSFMGAAGATGSSVFDATKGAGGLMTGGSEAAGGLFGKIPVVGKPFGSLVAGVGGMAGGLTEKFGQGLKGAFNLPFSLGKNRTRTKRSTEEIIAKNLLDSIVIELPESAGTVDEAFAQLAQQIRNRTLEAVRKEGLQAELS